jgi:tellurite resistance protein TerC
MPTPIELFPFAGYWWFYGLFLLFVCLVLALDLGVFHREAHEVGFKEALGWSVFWVGLAVLFGIGFYVYAAWKFPQDPRVLAYLADPAVAAAGITAEGLARQSVLEYFTGFLVEKSLAVDNIFVFIVVFNYFGIPAKYQHRVLFYGILGALVFRTIFIALGSILMDYHWVVVFFGVFLIATGIKILFAPEKPLDPEKNPLIKILRRFLRVTPRIEDDRFFLKKDGLLYATPLFICLVFIEISDIVFAVDSVPAIFALTREPLIVFTSNIFAILGLRAMFFLLAGVMDKFHYLKYGLGIVLVFVGLKMVWLNHAFGGKFPVTWSLGLIAGVLTVSVVASLVFPPRKQPA